MAGSILRKISKAAVEVPIEIYRLIGGKYPSFVTEFRVKPTLVEVPVFMYHSVEAASFGDQLQYLADNGYKTLTLTEFFAFLKGELELDAPSALLTFDDGDRSWYDVAMPLLQKYEFNAVGFLVPHYIEKANPEDANRAWLTWEEILELQERGVFEFESHTLAHDRIFTSGKLKGFFHPGFVENPLGADTPWTGLGEAYTNDLALGTPVFEHCSRFYGKLRYFENEAVTEACTKFVAENGGVSFFESKDWKPKLKKVFFSARSELKGGKYESEAEQKLAICNSLISSKELLEKKLGRPIRHLCYPFGQGSELAVELSKQAGYESNFWVAPGNRDINRKLDDPFYIPRLKDDYVFRLPGRGRVSLLSIFLRKLKRRATKVNIY
ncbi:MAG: polysaccharide deacetylase family protein [Opitutales bacterium]|nr:polysaccharide deacetylase family protein [Opitutales bacterium]